MLRSTLTVIVFAFATSLVGVAQDSEPTQGKATAVSTAKSLTPEQQDRIDKSANILGMGLSGLVCVGLFSLAFTLLPVVIAVVRDHNNTLAIGAVALFLGWTGIGWIVALVWSFTNDTKHTDRYRYGR